MAKESISQEDDIKREFNFATHSIISQVLRGVLVGIFRFLIEKIFHLVQDVYQKSQQSLLWLLALVFLYVFIVFLNARWVKSEKNIKGSGIPQVEAELKGLMSLSWWSVLWKKFVLGI